MEGQVRSRTSGVFREMRDVDGPCFSKVLFFILGLVFTKLRERWDVRKGRSCAGMEMTVAIVGKSWRHTE